MLLIIVCALLVAQASPGEVRNTWPKAYAARDAASFAAEFEEPSRALFRYRAAMAGLMQVKPGMKVGEVGAGSGYFSRYLAEKVGLDGHVYANELEGKMVGYMRDRAAKESIKNLTVVQGTATSTGFEPDSLDAIAAIYTFSFFDRPADMLRSMNAALKSGGVMLIVDIPSEQIGSRMAGADADAVVALASQHGFTRAGENGVVPGHYALIFRKN